MATAQHRNPLRGSTWLSRVWYFYLDGFREMTVGRTLWLIIGIKVFLFFVVLRLIFFPDFLSGKASSDEGKAAYVREQLTAPQRNISQTEQEPPYSKTDNQQESNKQ